MNFVWDIRKNEANIRKHGIPFEAAILVFDDEKMIERFDRNHSSESEERWVAIGMVERVLVVIFTEIKDCVRIISARKATREEINEYYKDYDLR
jgi:hypothetical protein